MTREDIVWALDLLRQDLDAVLEAMKASPLDDTDPDPFGFAAEADRSIADAAQKALDYEAARAMGLLPPPDPPEVRAQALGLLHWCERCPGTPEERAAVEEHEREIKGQPWLHRGTGPTGTDDVGTYDCDGCGTPTPRDELSHHRGDENGLPEGWFCEACTTPPR